MFMCFLSQQSDSYKLSIIEEEHAWNLVFAHMILMLLFFLILPVKQKVRSEN